MGSWEINLLKTLMLSLQNLWEKRNQQLSFQKLISIALDRAIDERPVDDEDVDAKDILEGRNSPAWPPPAARGKGRRNGEGKKKDGRSRKGNVDSCFS